MKEESLAISRFVEITAGGIRWHVQAELRDALFGPEGIRLAEWLRGGQAHVVKEGPHRAVYYIALPEARFFLKHNRLMDFRGWLRQLVRPAKARIEFEHALTVAARNLPTIIPLGLGERCAGAGPNDSFLMTHSLEDAQPLGGFLSGTFRNWPRDRQIRFRQRLAGELGCLMARIHDAGVAHRDLHPGNLLVREQDDQPTLYLVDLHAVRIGSPLTWPAARDNLALLNRWFSLRTGRTDRLRFWKAYRLARQTGGLRKAPMLADRTFEKRLALELEAQTLRSNLGFWRQRSGRCLSANRYFQRVSSAIARGHAVRELSGDTLAALLADPDELFRGPGVKILKSSPSSTVAELEMPLGGEMRRVIYKRFRATSRTDPWLALVRATPALRSWCYGHGLLDRGLPTARPLAVFHRRRHGLFGDGYLLTEKIPEAVELHQFLNGVAEIGVERVKILRLRIEQVARLVRDLHQRNLSQRDLKASNILLRPALLLVLTQPGSPVALTQSGSPVAPTQAGSRVGEGEPGSRVGDGDGVWLIDLVGIRCYRRLSRRRKVQNLARLHASILRHSVVTRTDKLRFLRCYMQWGLKGKGGWKKWWRQVEEATQAKVERNLRNGRPLG